MEQSLGFRFARREDVPLILTFIRALARYEKLEEQVTATPELLEEWIFDRGKAEVLFAVSAGREVGFALFFHNFSTFLGRAGLYLEDLYVLPEFRGRGVRHRHPEQAGRHRRGAGLRAPGVVVPGLERAQHPLLPRPGRPAHGRVDGVPRHRGHPGGAGPVRGPGRDKEGPP